MRLLGVLPGKDTQVPAAAIVALARQLDAAPPDLGPYWAGRQRWRHAGLIRTHYGYRDFDAASDVRFRLTRWLYALCWTGDDRPGPPAGARRRLAARRQGPAAGPDHNRASVRASEAAMQARRWEALAGAFTPEQRLRLDGVFEADDAFRPRGAAPAAAALRPH